MPKKAEIPDHWKEGAEQPEWAGSDDDVVLDNTYDLNPEMVYEEGEPEHIDLIDSSPEDLLNDEGTDRADLIEMTDKERELDLELERQQQKYDELQKKKETKTRIAGKKKQIRHMKYAPAYEAGAKLKAGGVKLKKVIDKKRGTPLERKIRKEKMKKQMKRVAVVAKKKGIAFGKSMKEQKPGGGSGMISGGFGSKFFDQDGKGSKTPRIMNMNTGQKMSKGNLMGNTGTKLMDKKVNLLGDTGQKLMGNSGNMFKKSGSGKPGSKLMNENILGSATGKNKDKKKRLI